MFTAYALNPSDPAGDTETECATLDEALTHLRELVLNEMSYPDAPGFERFGLSCNMPRLRQNKRLEVRPSRSNTDFN